MPATGQIVLSITFGEQILSVIFTPLTRKQPFGPGRQACTLASAMDISAVRSLLHRVPLLLAICALHAVCASVAIAAPPPPRPTLAYLPLSFEQNQG